jgi:S1-C subfamily serine protease
MNTLKGKIIAVVVVLVIAAAAYTAGSGMFGVKSASAQTPLYNQADVTSIYKVASAAVVEIDTTQQSTGIFGNSTQEGLGSGIVLDKSGNILTNNHVVAGATSVTVKFQDGTTVTGNVLGTDSIKDLAVVQVPSSAVANIVPLAQGDSNTVVPGEMAIAIGNPYGLDNSVSVGVISGLNRSIGNMTGMLQTDAALNPGNSGGPLLDASGAVIGINTAIESPATGATGIGFAIPIAVAQSELTSLEAGQTVAHPWIGISGETLTPSVAQQLGITADRGVYVVNVVSGSPAATAGLKGGTFDANGQPVGGGDVITAVDGTAVNTIQDLQNYVAGKKVGDTVTLTVLRGSGTLSIQVTLGAMPSNVTSGNTPNGAPNAPAPTPRNGGPGWHYFTLPGGGGFGWNFNGNTPQN